MSYESLLAQIPMFEHLAQEDLTHLSGLLQQRRYSKNEVIFHQGDVGTALFMVRRGEVAIRLSSSEGKEVILALLGRGDAFGELALLDGEPRSTDAVARDETHLLSLHQEDFRRFLSERPQVAMGLLAVLSRMVRRVTQLVHDSAFLDARARLARVLLDLARTQGQPASEGGIVIPKLTQAELANLCGVTRESANKWLRFYNREGLLTYENGQITIVDPERLRRDVDYRWEEPAPPGADSTPGKHGRRPRPPARPPIPRDMDDALTRSSRSGAGRSPPSEVTAAIPPSGHGGLRRPRTDITPLAPRARRSATTGLRVPVPESIHTARGGPGL